MYQIIDSGRGDGCAYVRDFQGNKCYYGSIKECQKFIRFMTKAYRQLVKSIKDGVTK